MRNGLVIIPYIYDIYWSYPEKVGTWQLVVGVKGPKTAESGKSAKTRQNPKRQV